MRSDLSPSNTSKLAASRPLVMDASPASLPPGRPLSALETFFLLIIALATIVVAATRSGVPAGNLLNEDSYQYLSVAENIRWKHLAATSIVHFDVERQHRTLPAPMTTFALGYPALIALGAYTGVRPEWVAVVFSVLSAMAVLALILVAGNHLQLSPNIQRVSLFAWAMNANAAMFGASIRPEGVFTAVILAACVLMLEHPSAPPPTRIFAAAALFGAAYWIRYAGLFFVIAFNLYCCARIIRDGGRRWRWVAGIAIADLLVLSGIARNVVLAHSWRGGNTRFSPHNPFERFRDLFLSGPNLILGGLNRSPALLISAVVFLCGIGLLIAACALHRREGLWKSGHKSAAIFAVAVGLYVPMIFYAALTSDISFTSRMLFPCLPLCILLAAHLWSQVALKDSRAATAGVILSLLGYTSSNLYWLSQPSSMATHAAVSQALAAPMENGNSLSDWASANIPPEATIVATNGQPTAYVLKRKTVSLVSKAFSDTPFTESETRRTMDDFAANHLVVYSEGKATLGPVDPVQKESPFLERLTHGVHPDWLAVAARNQHAIVYCRRR